MNRFSMSSVMQESFDSGEDPIPGIVVFLAENPRATDEQVHQWARDNGIAPERVEENIYALLGGMMRKMFKAASTPDSEFDPDQLARGIEVEKEHTDNEYVAKIIAKTHLLECKTYYTGLDKVEKECGVKD